MHLRLEDFIPTSQVLHPEVLKKLLDEINEKDICIVVNKPTSVIEIKYINYYIFIKYIYDHNIYKFEK